MSNGKNKGSNFERTISKKLSKWWTEGKRDDIFWRSQSSGGWNTIRKKLGKQTSTQYGDIQAIDSDGKSLLEALCIEVKIGYGKWDILDCLDSNKTVVNKFINQLIKEWKNSDSRYPCLIAKRDRKKEIIIFPKMLFPKIFLCNGKEQLKNKIYFHIFLNEKNFRVFTVMLLDDFLEWCSPDFFKEKYWI